MGIQGRPFRLLSAHLHTVSMKSPFDHEDLAEGLLQRGVTFVLFFPQDG